MIKQPKEGQAQRLPLSANTDDRTTHVAVNIQHGHKFFCRQTNEPSKHAGANGGEDFDSDVSYWIVPCKLYGSCYNGCSLWQGGFQFYPLDSWSEFGV